MTIKISLKIKELKCKHREREGDYLNQGLYTYTFTCMCIYHKIYINDQNGYNYNELLLC